MATPEPTRAPLGVKPTPASDTAPAASIAGTPVPNAPDLRDIDPRAAAAARAAQLQAHWGGEIPEEVNEYYIDPIIVPDGWSYEWKRLTVYNAPDPAYQVTVAQGGWEPVPTSRHPEMMPEGWDKSAQITRKGQGLFERPAIITARAVEKRAFDARLQMRQKQEQLGMAPKGQLERTKSDGSSLVKINRSYEQMPIPK